PERCPARSIVQVPAQRAAAVHRIAIAPDQRAGDHLNAAEGSQIPQQIKEALLASLVFLQLPVEVGLILEIGVAPLDTRGVLSEAVQNLAALLEQLLLTLLQAGALFRQFVAPLVEAV